jgi:hypothetical protein
LVLVLLLLPLLLPHDDTFVKSSKGHEVVYPIARKMTN